VLFSSVRWCSLYVSQLQIQHKLSLELFHHFWHFVLTQLRGSTEKCRTWKWRTEVDELMENARHENGGPLCKLRKLVVDFLFVITEIYSLARMFPPTICHRMKTFIFEWSFKRWSYSGGIIVLRPRLLELCKKYSIKLCLLIFIWTVYSFQETHSVAPEAK